LGIGRPDQDAKNHHDCGGFDNPVHISSFGFYEKISEIETQAHPG
jgi:hypothetical protein